MTTNLSDCDAPAGGFDREDQTLVIAGVVFSGALGSVQLQSDSTSTRTIPALSATWTAPTNPYIVGVQFSYAPAAGAGETIQTSPQRPTNAAWQTTQAIVGGATYSASYRAVGAGIGNYGPWSAPENVTITADVGPYAGDGEPTFLGVPPGSTYQRQDVSQQWRLSEGGGAAARVQEAAIGGGYTITLGSAPIQGNVLFAFGYDKLITPVLDADWTLIADHDQGSTFTDPAYAVAYKVVGSGESATQTPFTSSVTGPSGGALPRAGSMIIEVSNFDPSAPGAIQEVDAWALISGDATIDLDLVTDAPDVLAIALVGWWGDGSPSRTITANPEWTNTALDQDTGCSSEFIGSQVVATSGTTVNLTATIGGPYYGLGGALLLLRGNLAWRLMSDLTAIKVNGAVVDTAMTTLNIAGAVVSGATDGAGTVTVTVNSDADGTLAANSDAKVPTQKAVKTAVDAAKAYAEGLVQGLSWKQAARVATTANGTLASAFENGDTVDGVVLATGNRILVKNQSSAAENGIYTVNASGAPTRALDANSGAELVNATVYVSEGTANADTQWTCTTNATITLGSTSLAFAQLSAGGGGLTVKDEGSTLSAAVTSIDFTGTGVTASNVGGAVTVNIPLASSGSVVASAGLVAPQTRLTLVTGQPVMISDQTAKTHVFQTPYAGASTPVFDGANWTQWVLSADLDLSLDTTNQLALRLQDVFNFVDSGVLKIGAGPDWTTAATITVTIATPAVVTWTAHGLPEGSPVIFTNAGGALPTGITAGTTYYVGRSPAANTFNISTSVANAAAGTFVATSGSQSGTHTGTNHTAQRGTGAGTTELQILNGIWTNKNTITLTNGAGGGISVSANHATYIGTMYMTANGQTAFMPNTAAAAGGSAPVMGLWNAYNRVGWRSIEMESTAVWNTSSTTWHPSNSSVGNRITWIDGLQQSPVAVAFTMNIISAGSSGVNIGVGFDSTSSDPKGDASSSSTTGGNVTALSATPPLLGVHYVQAMESASSAATQTFVGKQTSPTRQYYTLVLDLMM